MSDKEILTKSIEKAIASGWSPTEKISTNTWKVNWLNAKVIALSNIDKGIIRYTLSFNLADLLFDHDFARALWGDYDQHGHGYITGGEGHCVYCGCPPGFIPEHCWQYHLQKMATSDDRIKYIGDNL